MSESEAELLHLMSDTAPFFFSPVEQYTNGKGISLAIRSNLRADLTVGSSWVEIPIESGSSDDGDLGWFIYLWNVRTWTGGSAKGRLITDQEKQKIAAVVVSALDANHAFVTVEMS